MVARNWSAPHVTRLPNRINKVAGTKQLKMPGRSREERITFM